jgi:uncharacterized protein YciI
LSADTFQRSDLKLQIGKGEPAMKFRILLLLTFVFCLPAIVLAQPSEHKMVQFQMAVMKKGPKFSTASATDRAAILQQHLANVLSLYEAGKVAIAGPFGDDSDLAGIFIFRTTSSAEAKELVDADPAVKAGLMTAEIHPWFSEDVFKKTSLTPLKLESVYFGFLKRGPNRKEGDDQNPEIQALQKAHIANIVRLADMKKMVMAGPFGDDGDLRGIFVFRAASLKEAQDLSATDPMIKIDRLRIELHPWNVPVGVLP